ncbi:MAG: helix-turn-helix transcriptional regulator, partial [Lactococcus lactis]|nr:helix-turn-helix transcriptional regulator [Lactococcus lactis]
LAEKLGMKQNAYVLWEQKSTNPTLEILEKLADIYDLPIQELIKETDNNVEKQLIDNYRSLTGEQQESVINFTDFLIEQNKTEIINLKTYRRSSLDYAIVEDEELSAGFGQSQSNTGGHYKAYTSETLGRYDGAARVKGESMEPEFPNFSIATFLHTGFGRSGDIYAIAEGDLGEERLYIKQVFEEEDGQFRIHSLNPDPQYKDFYLGQEDNFRIIGPVVDNFEEIEESQIID